MPNLHAHIALAQEAARRLCHPTIEAHLGSFLLGCTTPDIRVMTRGSREETHFSLISSEGLRDGIEGMFAAHPHLRNANGLTEPTQAFLCGYVSHLLADQMWIITMYRPYFGNQEVFKDRVQGNIMDRALQLELDRQGHETNEGFTEARTRLETAADGVEIGFISTETLHDWQNRVAGMIEREFSWERLRFMMRRAVSDPTDEAALELVERFLAHVPTGLEGLYKQVPQAELAAYKESVIKETMKFSREYLG